MAHRLLPIAVLITAAATAAACGGGGERTRPVRATGGVAAGTGYTSDQLEQALLNDLPGYQQAGEPDSGEYGALKPIQSTAQLQQQVKLDKPRCASAARAGGLQDKSLPAATTTFSRGSGQTATETLVSLSGDAAERQVKTQVPVGCSTFRTRVGAQWSEHEIVEAPPGTIGQGSRTVGVTTVAGSSHTKAWYVVLRGQRYLATLALYGPNATRDEAEQLARQAYDQAEKILP
ncbi:hypothetical protein J4573_19250 [Actinomadura barringtoniae]|uniref:Sensor domain-containing protein n=1 Tax=Actinomadura barringtoniae TaxID=1427535 RepID=A0A939PAY5_9ACTN|nr:hypothetical protein [Actinomadura barringtoniae]MBO2449250.1 hypothetical protein [Actinomadura barringtoniae]